MAQSGKNIHIKLVIIAYWDWVKFHTKSRGNSMCPLLDVPEKYISFRSASYSQGNLTNQDIVGEFHQMI